MPPPKANLPHKVIARKAQAIRMDADWTIDDLRPYAEHVPDAFGPNRVIKGSDWPVCRLRAEYHAWHDTVRALTAHLEKAAAARIYGGSAAGFYGITSGES